MGVSGSGKTAVGTRLAEKLNHEFLDADNFHPPANIEKMKHSIPLTDEDRFPWLRNLHSELASRLSQGKSVILACSALKETYRTILAENLSQVRFVYLHVDKETLAERLQKRAGHFFPKELLESQLATLETPHDALVVEENRPLDEVVDAIVKAVAGREG
ncbi:MAG: gluconokinase [Verrucomicrobia bacterium]|nr:gluconokinase [Verrucomicrobiota bacterium]MBV8481418.1 gluconokinase [Verrucomicrobiota bacterium]